MLQIKPADYASLLSGSLSRRLVDSIVDSVLQDPENFPYLYLLIHDENEKISWRAIWACEKLCRTVPEFFMDKRKELMELSIQTNHDGKKRILLSMLNELPLDDIFSVEFLNACMEWMFSPKESIGVQALSIRLSYKLCEYEPDLMPELRLYLENAETEYMSTGVRTSVRNTLLKINKKKK